MRNPFIFAVFTTWHTVFNKSLEEQIKIYSDPGFRQAFREDGSPPHLRWTMGTDDRAGRKERSCEGIAE